MLRPPLVSALLALALPCGCEAPPEEGPPEEGPCGLGFRDGVGPFFTMKLIEGQTLLDWLRELERPISVESLDELVDVLIKVCDALAMAHSLGIIHADIKTPNIMLGEFGAVYLMDWGNARIGGTPPPTDDSGRPQVLGTPSVLAPEQARAWSIDARTDVFGVGAIIYTFLAGRPPYPTGTIEARINAAAYARFRPLSVVARKAPVTLRKISARAMALNPADRFQTISELGAALNAFRRARVPAPAVTLAAGEVLMQQGEPGDFVYVVREGTFRVAIDGVDLPHTPGPGAVLGEVAMITDKPRTATVTAITDAVVLRIGPELLQEELGRVSPWVKTLVESLAHRLHRHSTEGR